MAASTIKLKLLVDTKAKKVILAEAGKGFIDFLIHLLSLEKTWWVHSVTYMKPLKIFLIPACNQAIPKSHC
ncbi:hypothetical protein ACOSQ4_032979 [Xanthoceras sorbifolium]